MSILLARISLSVVVHLIPNLLLYSLQYLPIHELWEWVKLLLMEESDIVVAKPPHFTLPVEQRILQYPSSWNINRPLLLSILLNSLFLSRSLSECSLSHALFKEHHNECSNLISCLNRVLRTLSEQHGHLIDLHHDIWVKELKPILQFILLVLVSLCILLPFIGLFINSHIWFINHPDSFPKEVKHLLTFVIVKFPWSVLCEIETWYYLHILLKVNHFDNCHLAQIVFLNSQRFFLIENVGIHLCEIS